MCKCMKQWIFGISIIVFRKWMFSNIVYYGTMALWYDGVMIRWRYDMMALWYDGVMIRWRYDAMALWYDGVMIRWRYDMMVLWYDGAMIRWRYDMMALWYDVPFYFLAPKHTVKLFSFPFLTSSLNDEDNFRNTSCILNQKSTFSLGIYLLNVFKVSVAF